MSSDYDPISHTPNSFTEIISDILENTRYKFYFLLFVIFFVITSDMFINRILSSFDKAVSGKNITNWGTFIQGIILIIACAIIDILTQQKIL